MRSLMLALAMVGLVACSSTRDDMDGDRPMSWREKITMPSNMRGALELEDAMVDRRDGLLTVQVIVLNDTASPKTYRVLYEWLDEDGRKIDAATEGWRRITQPGATREYITGTAPSQRASDWRLTFLDWKN